MGLGKFYPISKSRIWSVCDGSWTLFRVTFGSRSFDFFFGQRASEDFSVFLFHLVFWSRIFQSLRVQLIELDQLIKTEKQDSGAQFILGDPSADISFTSRHLMNQSTFYCLSSSPNISGLALHQWSYKYVKKVARFPLVCPPHKQTRFPYAMKEKNQTLKKKNFIVRARFCARTRRNGSRNLPLGFH